MEVSSPIPKKHARIEIIPLIDIMFFLLASFMMVSLSQVTMKGIKVNLPKGMSGQTQSKKDYYSFSVDKDGYIYWDKSKINYEDVPAKLNPIYAEWVAHKNDPGREEPKIFIRADYDTLHGNVTRLLDQIRSTGFQKIAFEINSTAAAQLPATKR
ncbi:MAG: ExbD/TolR family protein [Chthoniobacterales bacterium]